MANDLNTLSKDELIALVHRQAAQIEQLIPRVGRLQDQVGRLQNKAGRLQNKVARQKKDSSNSPPLC